jgi:hypothetical protein
LIQEKSLVTQMPIGIRRTSWPTREGARGQVVPRFLRAGTMGISHGTARSR